jgi:UDP-glucose 4-epimerase
MKAVFITGGAGFIGSHLSARFLREGWRVTAYDNLSLGRKELLKGSIGNPNFQLIEADLLDLETLKKSIEGHDLVYHMAANSDISQGAKYTDIDLKNGTLATYNVLEAMRLTGVSQMVFASSSAVYGESTVKPTPENYGPLIPISFYGASKMACEGLASSFAHNYGISVWAYRFANIVGSNATHGVIYDFIGRLKKNPQRLEVLGNGSQRKSYLHVEDCINGMSFGHQNAVLNPSVPFSLFNLASHGVSNVRFIAEQVVQQMQKHTGVLAELAFGEGDRGWRGDVAYTFLDGANLSKLGWTARLSSDEAVGKAIAEIVKEQTGS